MIEALIELGGEVLTTMLLTNKKSGIGCLAYILVLVLIAIGIYFIHKYGF